MTDEPKPALQAVSDALEPCAQAALASLEKYIERQGMERFPSDELANVAAVSQAASLRRIADALELLAR